MATNPNNGSIITKGASAVATSVTNTVSTASNIVVGAGGIASGVVSGVVGEAVSPIVDLTQKGSQIAELVKNPTLSGALSLLGRGFPPYRNELDQFASYNYNFTLGCLTNMELNFPLSYRTLGPLIKIIRSGGTGGNKIPTIYETDGKVEFFIEDVELKNHCSPNPGTRLSNALSINFKVIEPYSMGQFLHNLRTAALVAGHSNYIEAPFLLSVAFKGYDDNENVKAPIFSQRHFPIKIVHAQMRVTASGAEYDVKAVAYNDIASTDTVQSSVQDITFKGPTVGDALQKGAESLTAKINEQLSRQQQADQIPAADQYIISFPKSGILDSIGGTFASSINSATSKLGTGLQAIYEGIVGDKTGEFDAGAVAKAQSEIKASTTQSALGATLKADADTGWNDIGNSAIVDDPKDAGDGPFQEASFIESKEKPGTFTRGKLTYDTESRSFSFPAGTKIQDMIEEIVILSQYGAKFAEATPDAFGRVPWVRIETQVYNGTSFFNSLSTGADPKIYVYRVVPYEVDVSNIAAPRSSVLATFTRQAKAIKSYNYIYTGQNTDIIDFDLNFNMAFFTGVQANRGQRQQDSLFATVSQWAKGDRETATTTESAVALSPAGADGAAPIKNISGADKPAKGGGAKEGALTSLARNLNNMVIHSDNDMIGVDLTIHGDPYFLADAGMGNYVGLANPANNAITVDGSMNPIDGEIHVVLNFRTPIDYDDESGFVKYPLGGFLPIAMFSGVYQVIIVENNFKDGMFTQTLKLMRKRNQDLTLSAIAGALMDTKAGKAIGKGLSKHLIEPKADGLDDTT